MEKKKNLYKLDDFFLILSYLLIIPIIYIFRPFIGADLSGEQGIGELVLEFIQSKPFPIITLISSAVFLQILGRLIRREEKSIVKTLDLIVMYKTISKKQLQQNLDISGKRTEQYIRKLTSINRLNISYDGTYVRLESGTPEHSSSNKITGWANAAHTQPEKPPWAHTMDKSGTDAQSGHDWANAAHAQPEKPPWAHTMDKSGTDAQSGLLSNSQQGDLSSNTKESVLFSDIPKETSVSAGSTKATKNDLQNIITNLQKSGTPGKKFNVVLFIILFLAFWPIAFIYAASHYLNSRKGVIIADRIKKRMDVM